MRAVIDFVLYVAFMMVLMGLPLAGMVALLVRLKVLTWTPVPGRGRLPSGLDRQQKRANAIAFAYWPIAAFAAIVAIDRFFLAVLSYAIAAVLFWGQLTLPGMLFVETRRGRKMGSLLWKLECSDRQVREWRRTIGGFVAIAIFWLSISLPIFSTGFGIDRWAILVSIAWTVSAFFLWRQKPLQVCFTDKGIAHLTYLTLLIPWEQIDRYIWRGRNLTVVISRTFPGISTTHTIAVPDDDRETVDGILATYVSPKSLSLSSK